MTESYRRAIFLLGLNPVSWSGVEEDLEALAAGLEDLAEAEALRLREETRSALASVSGPVSEPAVRRSAAQRLFDLATAATARTLELRLAAARASLSEHRRAAAELAEARGLWRAFEPEIRATDPEAFIRLGECWLEMASALGHPGVLGVGVVEPDRETFTEEADEVVAYLGSSYAGAGPPEARRLRPLPVRSTTFDPRAPLPPELPPGTDFNKQLPRPRQILNMAARGVDESETPLIALGDMAFDSFAIFGEPARSLGLTCNTCHNKGVTNPLFFVPGLSSRPGTVDVSNAYFAPHANNGHFDPLDIPDLRGLRFTSPYGRNGRFESLREFTRNVIVNEFDGPEPDPLLLDGLVAYMLEFDFLANTELEPDGSLNDRASESARRGEQLFRRHFPQMGGSCATCHVPSDHFLDRRRHDIGTVEGAEAASRDRALDTPTLLGIRHTPPYFHDGRAETLRQVSEWFDRRYGLALSEEDLVDLTAYLETVGDGVEAYEDTLQTLEAELEEFSFFLSAYETLVAKDKPQLVDLTFETIAFEIRAHKWTVEDPAGLPILDRLATLMDEARAARGRGDLATVDSKVDEYRRLYAENAEVLR